MVDENELIELATLIVDSRNDIKKFADDFSKGSNPFGMLSKIKSAADLNALYDEAVDNLINYIFSTCEYH